MERILPWGPLTCSSGTGLTRGSHQDHIVRMDQVDVQFVYLWMVDVQEDTLLR